MWGGEGGKETGRMRCIRQQQKQDTGSQREMRLRKG